MYILAWMIRRTLEPHLRRLARQYPVVTVTGPRQSGKTTLCRAAFPKLRMENLENPDVRQRALRDPRAFLSTGERSLILDEIQRVPELASYIQGIVDEGERPGMFILSGSQQFEVLDTVSQSLAGRTALVRLLPFSTSELYGKKHPPSLDRLLYTGLFPRIHDKKLNPTEATAFYVATYLERDVRRLINVRDLATFERFLGICAARVGQLLNLTDLGSDCGIDQKTAKSWLSVLQASYVVFLLQPHHRNFQKRLTKSPKLYFCDTGLAAYLLGIHEERQLERHPLRGALFENFVVMEFLKKRYHEVRESNLFFFRDHLGNEVDLVLDHSTHVTAVEIKAGQTVASDFFKGLDFYSRLGKDYVRKEYLVYGGRETYRSRNVQVCSYADLTTLRA